MQKNKLATFTPGATITIRLIDGVDRYCIEFMDFDPLETSSRELSLLPSDSLVCGRIPVWAALQLTRNMDSVNAAINEFGEPQH